MNESVKEYLCLLESLEETEWRADDIRKVRLELPEGWRNWYGSHGS